MSKVCKYCHEVIEDESRKFCPSCGEVIDSELKLALEMEKIRQKTQAAKKQTVQQELSVKSASSTHASTVNPTASPAESTPAATPAKKSSNKTLFIIIPILLFLAVAAAFIFL